MLTLQIERRAPARKTLFTAGARPFVELRLSGPREAFTPLLALVAELVAGRKSGALPLRTSGEPCELWLLRGEGRLGHLMGEDRIVLAGDAEALSELELAATRCAEAQGPDGTLDEFFAYVPLWDGHTESGPAGELTLRSYSSPSP